MSKFTAMAPAIGLFVLSLSICFIISELAKSTVPSTSTLEYLTKITKSASTYVGVKKGVAQVLNCSRRISL